METTQITMAQQTVVEQIYEQLKVNDPDFWNADMIRDWLIENKEMFLKMEKEQIVKAFNEGYEEGFNDGQNKKHDNS